MWVKGGDDDPEIWDEILVQMDFQDTLQATIILLSVGDHPLNESKFTVKVFR